MKAEKGFTIVELLIVIVIIGILAAITIVAYNGITQRANLAKAQSNAETVQKVAEAFNACNNRYPGSVADFSATTCADGTTSVAKLPSGVSVGAAAPTSANATTYIQYLYKGGSTTTATGGVISYWDSTTAAVSTTKVYVGDGKSGDTFTAIAFLEQRAYFLI